MRITLFKKGLILLCIPFGLQFATIVVFLIVYYYVESGMQYQIAAIKIGQKVAQAGDLLLRMRDEFIMDTTSDQLQKLGPALEGYSKLRLKLEELMSIETEYEDLTEHARKLGTQMKNQVDEFGDAALLNERPKEPMLNSFKKLFSNVETEMSWLAERPFSPALASFSANEATADMIRTLIFFNIVINIVTATSLWLAIHHSVVKQVNLLNTNFARLARNEPLLQQSQGTDEVADFDRSFHEIADGVLRLRKERREYLEVMSTEMRKPLLDLQSVITFTQRIEQEKITQKGLEKLQSSSRTITRLIAMLNELIDFEQIEQGTFSLNRRETTPQEIINNAVECIVDRASSVKIKIAIDAPSVTFDADPDRLVQVLVNLLTNSIKFSPSGSTIDITVRQNEKETVFAVKDQGPGIEPAMQDKIFQPFEQVDQQRDSISKKGTGLGLSICKIIVESHGGKIWIESEPPNGSTFLFSI